jgi:triacylglycerol lipase
MIQNDIRLVLAGMPSAIEPQYSTATRALYAALHAGVTQGVTADLDVAYGPHARHRLDVYRVDGAKMSGVVIYVPGGGFTGGDKAAFANIGSYFAKRGLLGITMNYRLAPEVTWPAGALDVDAAVAWAKANAASFGADGRRVFLIGHSAGGSHCATFLFDPEIGGHEKVAGAALLSGAAYQLPPRMAVTSENIRAYFGDDDAQVTRRSAVTHVPGTRVPVLLAVAERDPGVLVLPTLALAAALTMRDDRCPPLMRLSGHNHFSPPCSLGTSDDELGGALVQFFADIK